MKVIKIDELTKKFGDVTALKGLNLEVEKGEIFGFLGPNGAGKSTVLNLLLGFISPTSGTASIFKYDPWEETQKLRQRVGILPEGYSLYDRLTAQEHLAFSLELRNQNVGPSPILERVGLTDVANQKVGTFSKGMRQRLALGTAIAGSPDLLILDEPSSGLDPNGIRKMRHIIQEERNRGATIIFSSHIMEEVKTICDRVGIVRDGKFVAVDTLNGLHRRANSRETLIISVDNVPVIHGIKSIEGVIDVTEKNCSLQIKYENSNAKLEALSTLQKTDATIIDIDIEKTSLEDLFAEYTIRKQNQQEGPI